MEHNRGQATLPTVYSMQQAGRHDLSRAVRVWGGASKLAQALGYKVELNVQLSQKSVWEYVHPSWLFSSLLKDVIL